MAALIFVATVLGFALNILASYQYVRVSAAMLFDMRLAVYRHLQTRCRRVSTRNGGWETWSPA